MKSATTGLPPLATRLRPYAGPLATIAGAIVALVATLVGTEGDLSHVWVPVRALGRGDLAGLYPEYNHSTSLTGWVGIVALPYLAGRAAVGDLRGYVFATLVAVPLALGGVRFALRALWPGVSPAMAWGVATTALVLPTTWAVWANYFHPQDLGAVGLLCIGLGLAARVRWGWAGVVFGVAVMTRQWALLAALPIAGLAGRRAVAFGAAGIGTCAVLLAPLLIAGGNPELFEAIAGGVEGATGTTAMGALLRGFENGDGGLVQTVVLYLARLAPVLGAAMLGVVAWRRGRGAQWQSYGAGVLVALAVSGLALRLVFERSDYLYYWVPFGILLLLLVPRTPLAWVAGFGMGTLPWVVDVFFPVPEAFEPVSTPRVVLSLGLALGAFALPWLLLREQPETAVDSTTAGDSPTPAWAWWGAGTVVALVVGLLLAGAIPYAAADRAERLQVNNPVAEMRLRDDLQGQAEREPSAHPNMTPNLSPPER